MGVSKVLGWQPAGSLEKSTHWAAREPMKMRNRHDFASVIMAFHDSIAPRTGSVSDQHVRLQINLPLADARGSVLHGQDHVCRGRESVVSCGDRVVAVRRG